jgi:hypothetical protein
MITTVFLMCASVCAADMLKFLEVYACEAPGCGACCDIAGSAGVGVDDVLALLSSYNGAHLHILSTIMQQNTGSSDACNVS